LRIPAIQQWRRRARISEKFKELNPRVENIEKKGRTSEQLTELNPRVDNLSYPTIEKKGGHLNN
jgi:hypothetical protein